MYDVLNDLGRSIQQFLDIVLPSCDSQWWDSRVLGQLTFQQRQVVDEKGITSLAELDLAGLLRVLDQNWHEISAPQNLSSEARSWLKEVQVIHTRWTHPPSDGLNPEDCYRDLDTVYRLMLALGADDSSISRVRLARENALSTINQGPNVLRTTTKHRSHNAIEKGDVVRLKARPHHTGAVINILEGGGETRFVVFHDGTASTYYSSQIELATSAPARISVAPDALHAALTALQLRHPSTSHLYSLFASRIQFVPYQFRPVLKFTQSDRPRMLIADEVGVGKTIEAGLILKEPLINSPCT